MYLFKLVKKNSDFDEERFSTDNVELACFIANTLGAELFYWDGKGWWSVDEEFIALDEDNGPFGKNTIGWPY